MYISENETNAEQNKTKNKNYISGLAPQSPGRPHDQCANTTSWDLSTFPVVLVFSAQGVLCVTEQPRSLCSRAKLSCSASLSLRTH